MKVCISHHLTLNFSMKYKEAMIHGYLVFLYSGGPLEEQTCLGSYREFSLKIETPRDILGQ